MFDADFGYFARKASEERELAVGSADAAKAAIHLALAEQYDRVAAAYQSIIADQLRGFH